jgi:NAD(P)-dependent dehydrogenase (short-subunit alcohol dehydrogenase family)
MDSYASIKSFAQRVIDKPNRVDAVLENAAAALSTLTELEGLETSLIVNVVGTMLLECFCYRS